MNIAENEAKQLVIKAAWQLVESGLVSRTWGNVSCRVSDSQFAVTPSGKAYESLIPADIVVCNINDLKYKGKGKPSSEKGVHALVYAADPEACFVIHTHQMMATAAGTLFKTTKGHIEKMPVSAEYEHLGGGVPIAGYGLPGSKHLRACVGRALAAGTGSKAILMARHGALCFGKDQDEAFAAALSLEKACTDYIGVLDFPGEGFIDGQNGLEEAIYRQILRAIYSARKDVRHVRFVSNPAVVALSLGRKKIKPLFDDFAQIIGTEVNIIDMPQTSKEIEQVTDGLGKNGAVLIRGKGALCCAPSRSDAEAIAMILYKGGITQAAGEKFKKLRPLSAFDCRLMRLVYLNRYAKRK